MGLLKEATLSQFGLNRPLAVGVADAVELVGAAGLTVAAGPPNDADGNPDTWVYLDSLTSTPDVDIYQKEDGTYEFLGTFGSTDADLTGLDFRVEEGNLEFRTDPEDDWTVITELPGTGNVTLDGEEILTNKEYRGGLYRGGQLDVASQTPESDITLTYDGDDSDSHTVHDVFLDNETRTITIEGENLDGIGIMLVAVRGPGNVNFEGVHHWVDNDIPVSETASGAYRFFHFQLVPYGEDDIMVVGVGVGSGGQAFSLPTLADIVEFGTASYYEATEDLVDHTVDNIAEFESVTDEHYMVLMVAHNSGGTGGTPVSVHESWGSPVFSSIDAGTGRALYIFGKFSGGDEPSTYLIETANERKLCAAIRVFSDVDPNTQMDVAPTHTTGNGTTVTAPTITPVTQGALVLNYFQRAGSVLEPNPLVENDMTILRNAGAAAGNTLRHIHGEHKIEAPTEVTGISGTLSTTNGWVNTLAALRPKQ